MFLNFELQSTEQLGGRGQSLGRSSTGWLSPVTGTRDPCHSLAGSLLVVAVPVENGESRLLFSVPVRMRVTSMGQVRLQKGLITVAIREMPESVTGGPTALQGQNQSQSQDYR
jgi:hypothetical protein